MKLRAILDALRSLAPEHYAADWDKPGLHVGDPDQPVRRILLCIDLTPVVLEEAISRRSDLIVAYHPPIFDPLKSLTTTDPKGSLILRLAQRGLAVYSPHTALDAAPGGLNDFLAKLCGRGEVVPIKPWVQSPNQPETFQVVTYIPLDRDGSQKTADRLRTALAQSGAGVIGRYTHCSFGAQGQATFLGRTGSRPRRGQPGRLERVAELRMEMVCPPDRLKDVLQTLRHHHPYEEPAFYVFAVERGPSLQTACNPDDPAQAPGASMAAGQGRVIHLDKPITFAILAQRIRRGLKVTRLHLASPTGSSRGGPKIARVGLCAGAGGSLIDSARRQHAIDAFVTGEMRHHDLLAASASGVHVLLAGHTETERPYLPTYKRRILHALRQLTGSPPPVDISRKDRPPGQWR